MKEAAQGLEAVCFLGSVEAQSKVGLWEWQGWLQTFPQPVLDPCGELVSEIL